MVSEQRREFFILLHVARTYGILTFTSNAKHLMNKTLIQIIDSSAKTISQHQHSIIVHV